METQSHKNIYFEDEFFRLEYEVADDILNLHCIVRRSTPRAFRNMYNVFGRLLEEAKEKGFKQLMTVTPNPKFAQLFGGTQLCTLISDMGKEYEVYVWDLK